MAEAGSFADRVKQQADIVRVIGEYVRLKKSGAEFHRPLPVPSGKNAVVCRASREADLSLLRLRRGRRRFQIRDGDGKIHLSRSGAHRRGKMRHRDSASRASVRPRSASENQQRTALVEMHREAAAFFARQLERHAGRQSRSAPICAIAASTREAMRASAWASRPRRATRCCARSEAEISGKAARSLRPVLAAIQSGRALRPLPAPHHVSHRQRIGKSDRLRRPRAGRRPCRNI